jgi:argininosuccinate lyase
MRCARQQTLAWVDANPLGSAAGYGVNLPLARDHTTQTLGFGRMQVSAAYAQLSRGKFEMAAIEAMSSALLDLRRLAWDLSLFTSAEFGFVALPAQYTTGSSIMPNKRNPDVIELMRASYSAAAAARTEIEQLLSLPSGYHRDLQFSKGAIFHAFGRGLGALELLPDLLRNLEWKTGRDARRAGPVDVRHRLGRRSGSAGASVPRGPTGRRPIRRAGPRATPRPASPRAFRPARRPTFGWMNCSDDWTACNERAGKYV